MGSEGHKHFYEVMKVAIKDNITRNCKTFETQIQEYLPTTRVRQQHAPPDEDESTLEQAQFILQLCVEAGKKQAGDAILNILWAYKCRILLLFVVLFFLYPILLGIFLIRFFTPRVSRHLIRTRNML